MNLRPLSKLVRLPSEQLSGLPDLSANLSDCPECDLRCCQEKTGRPVPDASSALSREAAAGHGCTSPRRTTLASCARRVVGPINPAPPGLTLIKGFGCPATEVSYFAVGLHRQPRNLGRL